MKGSKMNFFNSHDIDMAKEYKYSGVDKSICIKLFYRKYWDWCMRFVPMSLAPNTITFIGFVIELASFVVSLAASGWLQHEIPRWTCVANGIALFAYQTLDNLDGRQARRTGMSSPLGQFFDHGCDAITGVSELMKCAASFGMGQTDKTFFFVFLMGVGFALTSWEEYVCHTFYLGYITGPDEGLLLLAVSQVAVGLFPQLQSIILSRAAAMVFVIGTVGTCFPILWRAAKNSKGDSYAKKRAAGSIIPIAVTGTLFGAVAVVQSDARKSPAFVMAAGFALQYLAQNIIVSYLVKRGPRALYSPSIVTLWSACGASLAAYLCGFPIPTAFWPCMAAGIVACMAIFDIRVVRGLSKGLGIPTFHIPKEKIQKARAVTASSQSKSKAT